MSTSQKPPPSLTVTSAASQRGAPAQATHADRRWFIGPMPEKALQAVRAGAKKRHWLRGALPEGESEDDDSLAHRIIRDHAFKFFLDSGGNEEDWGERAEVDVREKMIGRWQDSEWGRATRGANEPGRKEKWVGTSFEVGVFMGVRVQGEAGQENPKSLGSKRSGESFLPSTSQHIAGTASTSAGETFLAAPSELQTPGSHGLKPPHVAPSVDDALDSGASQSADSPTGLMSPPLAALPSSRARTRLLPPPVLHAVPAARSESHVVMDSPTEFQGKGKGKQVHYVDPPAHESSPVPPQEVLRRTGSAVKASSAGASVGYHPPPAVDGEIVMGDRMLIRINYTKVESVGSYFDEAQNRTTNHLQHEGMGEFLVVWRKDIDDNHWIEIYQDHSLPMKGWLLRHKFLAFVIPIHSPSSCLSLYSFVDLSFCLTCHPTSTDKSGGRPRNLLKPVREGTNVFVFKGRNRTRSMDWIWRLWRKLGGQLPPFLEVRSPSLDTRVKIDVPQHAPSILSGEGSAAESDPMFTRENTLALCIKVLKEVSDWAFLLGRATAEGRTLELAWRSGTSLDWVWLEEDAEGNTRDWAVLAGLALKQLRKPCHLEIRAADHIPSFVPENGVRLPEPDSIEGYLSRIKPNTQTQQPVYLTTHHGLLFVLPPTRCHPPPPPGADLRAEGMAKAEVERGARQVMDAFGVCDLRNIVAVRKAFHAVPIPTARPPLERANTKNLDGWASIWVAEEGHETGGEANVETATDDEGDEPLAQGIDKVRMRTRRSFELLLVSRHVIRFEAYSRRTAVEWIDRLRALIKYWRQRHIVDAREEMDLAQFGSDRPPVTPKMHPNQTAEDAPPEPPADPNANMPALGTMYNWCMMKGCKSVGKTGKLFTRRGLRGPYKLVEMVLISECLLQYQVTPKSALHTRDSNVIYLHNAYVFSGYFAAMMLPGDQYNPEATIVARRYQDGLESNDLEEDTLFAVWYHPMSSSQPGPKDQGLAAKPKLKRKNKLVVFRTRSKLERDAWCWAINCEIERLVRERTDKEDLTGLI